MPASILNFEDDADAFTAEELGLPSPPLRMFQLLFGRSESESYEAGFAHTQTYIHMHRYTHRGADQTTPQNSRWTCGASMTVRVSGECGVP